MNNASKIEAYPWGQMEWLANQASHPGTQTSLARMTVKPGADTPLHLHDNCSELLHVLQGAVELQVSAYDPLLLNAGQTHLIPTYRPHSLRNVGEEDAELMLSYSTAKRHYQELEQSPANDS